MIRHLQAQVQHPGQMAVVCPVGDWVEGCKGRHEGEAAGSFGAMAPRLVSCCFVTKTHAAQFVRHASSCVKLGF